MIVKRFAFMDVEVDRAEDNFGNGAALGRRIVVADAPEFLRKFEGFFADSARPRFNFDAIVDERFAEKIDRNVDDYESVRLGMEPRQKLFVERRSGAVEPPRVGEKIDVPLHVRVRDLRLNLYDVVHEKSRRVTPSGRNDIFRARRGNSPGSARFYGS